MRWHAEALDRAVQNKRVLAHLMFESALARGESPDLPVTDRITLVWAMRGAKQAVEARNLRCALEAFELRGVPDFHG